MVDMEIQPEYWQSFSSKKSIIFHHSGSRNKFRLKIGSRFETNIWIEGVPADMDHCGAFTIIRHSSILTNLSIGRWCSVAPQVHFGLPEHPIDWLSTSSGFANRYKWMGEQRFERDLGGIRKPATVVGNDVWIGRGATIKAGVTIGDGAIIAGKSMVTKDVEPYTIVGGNPAKVIRRRFPDDVIAELLRLQWWQYDPSWIAGQRYKDVRECIDYLNANAAKLRPLPIRGIEVVNIQDEPIRLLETPFPVRAAAPLQQKPEPAGIPSRSTPGTLQSWMRSLQFKAAVAGAAGAAIFEGLGELAALAQ